LLLGKLDLNNARLALLTTLATENGVEWHLLVAY